ncbi:MAG TPA: hypothetical protein VL137_12260 [Polyangiaceae bacterium]|nr:hypothetical protein [Polyangiaceae bacterium]
MKHSKPVLGLAVATLVLGACSSSTKDTTGGTTMSMGGTSATGGSTTTTGGTTTNVGGMATGMGGSTAVAGSGGTPAVGGNTTMGGNTAVGGTGGAPMGGTPAVGGTGGDMGGTGGAAPMGGTGGGGGMSTANMSAGCTKQPPAMDTEAAFVKHDIAVTGVSQTYIDAHPLVASDAPYSFTMRNYYVKLPVNYDPMTAYRVQFGGPGCGGPATVGSEGGYLPSAHDDVILISPSYVPTQGATSATNPGSCFADGATDSPDVPYFDAVLAEVEANYCVNPKQISVSGYSSGAWEALLLGWARAGVVRGIATEAGGLRHNRPAGTNMPVAALMIGTQGDTENPIDLMPTDAKAIELGADGGSGQARDEILMRNGCTGTDTAMWDAQFPACLKYTGCPAAYPVVWCLMTTGGHYPAHMPYTPDAMAKFLDSLPDVP